MPKHVLGNHLGRQLIRSSTSAAANYRAACMAQSSKTFASKISIVLEESDESYFWIEFILDEKLVKPGLILNLLKETNEGTLIFAASRKTISKKNKG